MFKKILAACVLAVGLTGAVQAGTGTGLVIGYAISEANKPNSIRLTIDTCRIQERAGISQSEEQIKMCAAAKQIQIEEGLAVLFGLILLAVGGIIVSFIIDRMF